MFRVNSDLPARIINSLNSSGSSAAQAIERLSSGLRINRAADDPVGLTMSDQLRSMIASLQQAGRNANVAISFSQTAEGGLEEIGDIVSRLKELSISAADTSISTSSRSSIQIEASELLDEIDRIANVVGFNGTSVLASTDTFTFFVGEGSSTSSDTIALTLPASQASQFIAGITSANIATSANDDAITSLDLGVTSVSLQRSEIGAVQNRLEAAGSEISSRILALQSADSVIRDADLALESLNLVRAQILSQSNIFALTQSNIVSQSVLSLFSTRA